MPSYALSSSDKLSPKFVFAFLLLHGFLFLGIEYILFQTFAVFMLVHAMIGIAIYLIFWRASFPRLFQDVLIGAAISVIAGILFGDFLLDNFFFLYEEAPKGFIPTLYSMLIVFYIYFYVKLARQALLSKWK